MVIWSELRGSDCAFACVSIGLGASGRIWKSGFAALGGLESCGCLRSVHGLESPPAPEAWGLRVGWHGWRAYGVWVFWAGVWGVGGLNVIAWAGGLGVQWSEPRPPDGKLQAPTKPSKTTDPRPPPRPADPRPKTQLCRVVWMGLVGVWGLAYISVPVGGHDAKGGWRQPPQTLADDPKLERPCRC